ncbi:MAG: energy-coupling factor ABC transporter ATP-binding protein [Anaerolineaceae bacterium]|nr:energy-coupling factor ABC transporter ATP-binding protein [Anaerolineaceae bacterium]
MVLEPIQPFIKIDNVFYTHWNQEEPTLKGVSLEILPNTINVLVGPGGSGKSTLCSLFNGEIPHLLGGKLEGSICVEGKNTNDLAVKNISQIVGHMLQDPETMFATLYVEDEIAFGPENLLLEVDEINLRVNQLLEMIQLSPQRKNLVWDLSGGQIQKLGLAVILAMNPKMIVLDEPTANLDPSATRSVHELILELKKRGMTILLVTRELDDFILSEANQLLVLDDGRIIASGDVQTVLKEHGNDMVNRLGIWLPETVEIGIALRDRFGMNVNRIPITVKETLYLLNNTNLLKSQLKLSEIHSPQFESFNQSKPLISARNLDFTYKNGYKALKDISFDIYPGEMLAIVGRNGAGKSTLAKLMVGLLKPQIGDLDLFDKPASAWKVESLAEKIALVFQNPEHQFLTDTTYEEIAYSLLSRGIDDPDEVKQQVEEWMVRLELVDYQKVHPFALSAGKKRRLGVATMLICNPQVLLVDEPTYGQDKEMTQNLMTLMESIRRKGVTIVMITHDMRLVQEFASRVLVMADGQILFEGDPSALFCSDKLLESANLRPTLLQELLKQYEDEGGCVCCAIKNTDDFLNSLEYSNALEGKDVIQ